MPASKATYAARLGYANRLLREHHDMLALATRLAALAATQPTDAVADILRAMSEAECETHYARRMAGTALVTAFPLPTGEHVL
jgi:enoyl-CoA hydratase/carnithine racemase